MLLAFAAAAQEPAPGIAVTNTVPPTVSLPSTALPPGSSPSRVVDAVGGQPLVVPLSQLPPSIVEQLRQVVRPPQELRTAQSYIVRDDYPPAAGGAHGTVRISLFVDKQGRGIGCEIRRSSGSAVLDFTACNLLKRRARYTPAVDRNGNPSVGIIEQQIEW